MLLVRVAAARFDALVDVSEADWRKCHPCRGVADRRAKGVRSQCRRSLTLVEDSLNPVEEIEDVAIAWSWPSSRSASGMEATSGRAGSAVAERRKTILDVLCSSSGNTPLTTSSFTGRRYGTPFGSTTRRATPSPKNLYEFPFPVPLS